MSDPTDVRDTAILVAITITRLGNRRKLPKTLITVDADEDSISASKVLLASDVLADINALHSQFLGWVNDHALPSLFKPGIYLLPLTFIERFEARMAEHIAQHDALVDMVCEAYPALVHDAAQRLRAAYDPQDYIPLEGNWRDRLRAKFSISHRYFTMETPTALRDISAHLFAQEREKAAHQWVLVTHEIQQMLRAEALALLEAIQTKLASISDGQPVRLQQRSLEKVDAFFSTFQEGRNITNDTELQAVLQQAQSLLHGIDAKALTHQDVLRSTVQERMAGMTDQIRTMLDVAPQRAYHFEEALDDVA